MPIVTIRPPDFMNSIASVNFVAHGFILHDGLFETVESLFASYRFEWSVNDLSMPPTDRPLRHDERESSTRQKRPAVTIS